MTATLPRFEIRIPISPNNQYLRMLRYFLASVDANGGPIARNARVVLSVSSECDPFDLAERHPWLKNYNLDVRWVDPALFDAWSYYATVYDRFLERSDADVVAMVDVDLFVAGDFDDLVLRAYQEQSILGFIAHVSPFANAQAPSSTMWERVFDACGVPNYPLVCEHTGWGLMSKDRAHRFCPPYYNFGVVIAPRWHFDLFSRDYLADLEAIDSVHSTWFRAQIANTVAIARHALEWGTIPLNFNYPLHVSEDGIRRLNPDPNGEDDIDDIRIFHYLGRGEINKSHFETSEALSAVIRRSDLSRPAAALARHLRTMEENGTAAR